MLEWEVEFPKGGEVWGYAQLCASFLRSHLCAQATEEWMCAPDGFAPHSAVSGILPTVITQRMIVTDDLEYHLVCRVQRRKLLVCYPK